MKIVYIDIDGVVADFDKGRKEHPLGNVTPYKGRPDKLPGVYKVIFFFNIIINPLQTFFC